MTYIQSIILGIIQGVTEFLPVSSSGHLTLVEHYFGTQNVPLLYDVLLHVASLAAVLIYFRKKITQLIISMTDKAAKEQHREIGFIIVSTIVTTAMLIVTKKMIHHIKDDPRFLTITFLLTAIFIFIAHHLLKKGVNRTTLNIKDALFIGAFQGIAVLPGISRSGTTIFAGLLRKIDGEKAIEYSFLLSIPAISGAAILEGLAGDFGSMNISVALIGMLASFIASLSSLYLLVYIIRKKNLFPFSIYLVILSIISFVSFFL